MITEETVLILGAGASADYGYPLGRQLMLNICDSLKNESSPLYKHLVNCNFHSFDREKFAADLRECNLPSIDAFLENRNEFERIGKAAIAGTLIPYEDKSLLSRTGWYEYLHSLLIGRKEEFMTNKLSVVTFNYDRSFEASLFIAVQKSYNLTDTEAASYVKSIPVIHLYGQLGGLPYLSENPRSYNPLVHADIIKQTIDSIKIVHEGKEDTPEFKSAQKKIIKAKIVCCLGFGYHPANVKRLRLSETLQGSGRKIYLSTYGFSTGQVQKLEKRLFPNGSPAMLQFQIGDHPVHKFLTYTAALE